MLIQAGSDMWLNVVDVGVISYGERGIVSELLIRYYQGIVKGRIREA